MITGNLLQSRHFGSELSSSWTRAFLISGWTPRCFSLGYSVTQYLMPAMKSLYLGFKDRHPYVLYWCLSQCVVFLFWRREWRTGSTGGRNWGFFPIMLWGRKKEILQGFLKKYFSSQAQMEFTSGVSALLFQGYLIACLKANFQLSHSGRNGYEPTHTASTSVTTA